MTRVVLDTNIVISGTIAPRGTSAAILDAWRNGEIEVVTCPDVLMEINEKLRLPRIQKKYRLAEGQISQLIREIGEASIFVPGAAPVNPAPPDPDDAMLFASAIESGADYIVTGDSALLTCSWPGAAKVVSPREFWELLVHRGN
jgi:putative PIN family toxin of toxin-antitoxin system